MLAPPAFDSLTRRWNWCRPRSCVSGPLLALSVFLMLPLTAAADTLAQRYWVPRDQLSPAEASRVPEFCRGAYRPPAAVTAPVQRLSADSPLLDIAAPGDPVYAEADRGELTLDKEATLSGNVRIVQGSRRLLTDEATVDLQTRKLRIETELTLQDENALLSGQSAVADMDSKTASLTDAQFLLFAADMRGTAEGIEQDETGNKIMNAGSFTRCEPNNRNWRFTSRSLRIAKDDPFATARGAVLRVRDVPVFYTPYIRFPVTDERQSGWLFPNIGYSSEDGLDLAAPYYLNLAPHYDATLVPRYLGKRGLGLEAQFRHLSSWGESVWDGAFLPSDDLFDGTYDKDDFEELFPGERFRPADRWLLGMQHQGGFDDARFGGRFRTQVDYTPRSEPRSRK